eukprot:253381_1
MLLIQGWEGHLNLPICLNNVTNHERKLLTVCKTYIEQDLIHKQPYLDNVEEVIKELLAINKNKSEYHYLLGVITQMQYLNKQYKHTNEAMKISTKCVKTAYDLNSEHPIYILECNTEWGIGYQILNNVDWYHNMETKLKNSTYRKKYNAVIDEVECMFIHEYQSHLLHKIDPSIRYVQNNCINSLNKYYRKYKSILEKLRIHPINDDGKYLYIWNHLYYCKNFAVEFRMFGQIKKSLDAMMLFINTFDPNYEYLMNDCYDTRCYLIVVDCMFALGLFKQCVSFLKKVLCVISPWQKHMMFLVIACLCRAYTHYQNLSVTDIENNYIHYLHKWFCIIGNDPKAKLGVFHQFATVCLRYYRVMLQPGMDVNKIQQFATDIENIMNTYFLVWGSSSYSYFGESCFMLGNIYQYKLCNVKCGIFLYYLCILHSYPGDYMRRACVDRELKPLAYTNVMAYYNMAICLFFDKQYQLSRKLFLRIIKFTKDLKIINNCKQYVKKLRNESKKRECKFCRRRSMALKSCKGCGMNFYCSVHCQKIHWNVSHRFNCTKYWSSKKFFIDSKSLTVLDVGECELYKYVESLSGHFMMELKRYS